MAQKLSNKHTLFVSYVVTIDQGGLAVRLCCDVSSGELFFGVLIFRQLSTVFYQLSRTVAFCRAFDRF